MSVALFLFSVCFSDGDVDLSESARMFPLSVARDSHMLPLASHQQTFAAEEKVDKGGAQFVRSLEI